MRRKVGERAKVLFDSIDLAILELLDYSFIGLSVSELVSKLKIKHKNLKPHIDKLRKLELISLWNLGEKIILWTELAEIKRIFDNNPEDFWETKEEIKKAEERLKKQRILREYLFSALKTENLDKKLEEEFQPDLRKIKKSDLKGIKPSDFMKDKEKKK